MKTGESELAELSKKEKRPSRKRVSKRITNNQYKKMAKEILAEENDAWSYTNNCAGFANKIFKATTGISFDGYPLTPKKLKEKIDNMK